MQPDLISREALLDIVGKMPLDWEYGKAVSDIYDIIKAAPAVDAVEVVRCKDCKYMEKWDEIADNCYMCNHGRTVRVRPDHFCSYGERLEAERYD